MPQSFRAAARRAQSFWSDRKGGVAVMTAVALTGLLGTAGLGTEATMWYVAKRNMQGAADAAAYTAATAELAGQNSTSFTAAAKAVAKQYGFTAGAQNVTIAVNNPPSTGGYTTNGQAIEVIVTQPQTMLFSQFFLASAPSISARAVALPGSGTAGCVMALNSGNVVGVSDSGSGTLSLPNCSLLVNSSSTSAVSMSGSTQINAESASIVGNVTTSGTARLSTTDGTSTGASVATDPYASMPVPSFSSCNSGAVSVLGTKTIGPSTSGGTYVICGTVSLSGASAHLTLQPGIYIIDGGNLNLSGGATLTATGGVTIVLTGSGSTYGSVNESGTSTINIAAPSTGPTAGVAIYQDRNAPSTGSNSFSGSSSQNIVGAMYFPNQKVTYSGSTSGGGSTCTQLIASTLAFSGSTTFNSNCSGTGVLGMGGGSTKLVE